MAGGAIISSLRRGIDLGRERWRALPAAEEGQSALFAVLTLMLLLVAIAYAYNVGLTVSERVRLQNAADAAAYAGAVQEANTLSAIAWLNSCETTLHSRLQERMIDLIIFTTASAIVEWGRFTKATAAANRSQESERCWRTRVLPHFLPLPMFGPDEVFGSFTDLGTGGATGGRPPVDELLAAFNDEYFAQSLTARLAERYGATVATAADLVTTTQSVLFRDAKYWVADRDQQQRRGETWMRQLSLVAAALARALPFMVRNEVIYHVRVNAPLEAKVAIFPDPVAYGEDGTPEATDSIPFVGEPALADTDAAASLAFFRYDRYADNLGDNRFLAESRRQAGRQNLKCVEVASAGVYRLVNKASTIWNEVQGQVQGGGTDYQRWLRCWNSLDRNWQVDQSERCELGYLPGSGNAHPVCRGDLGVADNAADGHWHFSHYHSHSENCTRCWGGFCYGFLNLNCLARCIAQEIRFQRDGETTHHMQFLLHHGKQHADGLALDDFYNLPGLSKKSGVNDPLEHVICAQATDNESSFLGRFNTQYPDIIPGMRFPKICFLCSPIVWVPFVFFSLPLCACAKCDTEAGHGTAGCNLWWAELLEWLQFPPHQSYPGNFYRESDWEGRWSGDYFFYHPDQALGSFSIPDWPGLDPYEIMNFLSDLYQAVQALVNSTVMRWSHHEFMVCPLCAKKCPLCGEKHWGTDKDPPATTDNQSDVGLTYYQAARGHDRAWAAGGYDSYDLDFDVDDGVLGQPSGAAAPASSLAATRPWNGNYAADRFVRGWSSPRRTDGSPHTGLAPAVVMTENFFRYGLSVGVWAPHRTIFFGAMFGTRPGMFALATARVGFAERSADGRGAGAPGQLISGAREKCAAGGRWDLDRVWSNFLAYPTAAPNVEGNLYYSNWGAKLVSARYAILPNGTGVTYGRQNLTPVGGKTALYADQTAAQQAFWQFLGATYCFDQEGKRLTGSRCGDRLRALVLGGSGDGDATAWQDFIDDYLKGLQDAQTLY